MAATGKGLVLAPDRASHPVAAIADRLASPQGMARDPLSVRLAARAQEINVNNERSMTLPAPTSSPRWCRLTYEYARRALYGEISETEMKLAVMHVACEVNAAWTPRTQEEPRPSADRFEAFAKAALRSEYERQLEDRQAIIREARSEARRLAVAGETDATIRQAIEALICHRVPPHVFAPQIIEAVTHARTMAARNIAIPPRITQ